MDADGYDDLLIGSYANTAWLVNGPVTGTSTVSAVADATVESTSAGFSQTMDGGGDVDADGHDDILIGSPYASSYTGAAFLFLGVGRHVHAPPGAPLAPRSRDRPRATI